MAQVPTCGSYESDAIGDRFHLGLRPTTLLARTASVSPIAFTRLKSGAAPFGRTKDVLVENAYLFHVQLLPAVVDMWIDAKHRPATTTTPGTTFLYDLRSNPVAEIHSSFDNIRFYVSQATLDEFAFDHGIRRIRGLGSSHIAFQDRVMWGLANALLDSVEHSNERSTLFIDHVALTFCAHVVRLYGDATLPEEHRSAGGLSPWQLRRVLDFIAAHFNDDPSIARASREIRIVVRLFFPCFPPDDWRDASPVADQEESRARPPIAARGQAQPGRRRFGMRLRRSKPLLACFHETRGRQSRTMAANASLMPPATMHLPICVSRSVS